jgi:hypothetical protein
VTEDERRVAYAEAFLKQARSDWRVYRLLLDTPDIPPCHSLHYLQMACEKVAKAYRLRDTASPVDTLLSKHVGFPKFVSAFLKSPQMKRRYAGKDAQLGAFERTAATLARAIERLAPAVDRGAEPDNSEYPWETAGGVMVPCEFGFPGLSRLREPTGQAFLKLIDEAMRDFDEVETA